MHMCTHVWPHIVCEIIACWFIAHTLHRKAMAVGSTKNVDHIAFVFLDFAVERRNGLPY